LFADPLALDAQALQSMRQRFAARGMSMPAVNEKQAWMPRSATVIPNANGSAPGVHWSRDGCEIFLLPGVPNEMQAMLLEWIVPRLQSLLPVHECCAFRMFPCIKENVKNIRCR
jgi:nicotinamide-nucleotide amidase